MFYRIALVGFGKCFPGKWVPLECEPCMIHMPDMSFER